MTQGADGDRGYRLDPDTRSKLPAVVTALPLPRRARLLLRRHRCPCFLYAIDNCNPERRSNAASDPVATMQAIVVGWVYHAVERDPLDIYQALHKCEAAKNIDPRFVCDPADRIDHRERLFFLGGRQYGREILQVHQDNVGLGLFAQFGESFANGADGFVERGGRGILVRPLPDGIRPNLPNDEIRLRRYDIGPQPLKLDRRFLAADAFVDHGDDRG
jgi:hypothetical protein